METTGNIQTSDIIMKFAHIHTHNITRKLHSATRENNHIGNRIKLGTKAIGYIVIFIYD